MEKDSTARRFVDFMSYVWEAAPPEIEELYYNACLTAVRTFRAVDIEPGPLEDGRRTLIYTFGDNSWAQVLGDGTGILGWCLE